MPARARRHAREPSLRQCHLQKDSIEPSSSWCAVVSHTPVWVRFAAGAIVATLVGLIAFPNLWAAKQGNPVDVLTEELQNKPVNLSLFEFGPTTPITLPSGYSLNVAGGSLTWHIGNFTKEVKIVKIESLIHADNVAEMLNTLPNTFSMAADSVDGLPSYEHYLQHDGATSKSNGATSKSTPAEKRLGSISNAIIETRILPFVRQWYNCSECRVCTSLVRRYQADQRTRHPPHFDTQAFITVVVHLTTHGLHFHGGLYVRTMPGTEQFLGAVLGDAVSHQHDVEHGVWVQEGNRYSWILWVQDSLRCKGPSSSWHQEGVLSGDPIAQYHMSGLYASGRGGVPKNDSMAADLLKNAASQGYSRAQHKLGNAFFSGIGVEEDATHALQWYVAAASQNSTFAAYTVGRMLEYGFGSERDDAAAAGWYKKAAGDSFEQYPDAADRLAKMLFKGVPGLAKNASMALILWRQAADQGQASAALSLAECYDRGDAVEVDAGEARMWRARASVIHARRGSVA